MKKTFNIMAVILILLLVVGCGKNEIVVEIGKSQQFTEAENVIVLLSDFEVIGNNNPTLNPDSTYTDWKWFLVRDSKASTWKIQDWGY